MTVLNSSQIKVGDSVFYNGRNGRIDFTVLAIWSNTNRAKVQYVGRMTQTIIKLDLLHKEVK